MRLPRIVRRSCALAIAGGVAVALAAPVAVARALEPVAHGWWTMTEPGEDPAAPLAPEERPTLAPGVPEGGLLVEGGFSGPRSYAAVRYELPDGATATALRLVVAPGGTISGSSVVACPLTGSFTPADGGPMAAAPPYDCASVVSGVVDGDAYVFDVASLARASEVAIALLPAAPADRVAFERPADGSLIIESRPEPAPPGPDTSEMSGATSFDAVASEPTSMGTAPPTPTFASVGTSDAPSSLETAAPPLPSPAPPRAAPAALAAQASPRMATFDANAGTPAGIADGSAAIGRSLPSGRLALLVIGAGLAVTLWFAPSRLTPVGELAPNEAADDRDDSL